MVNAVVDETELAERRLDGRDRSWLECRLQSWGEWHEQNDDYEGHARASSIAMFLDGFGGGRPGSRVLLVPRPEEVRRPDSSVSDVFGHSDG